MKYQLSRIEQRKKKLIFNINELNIENEIWYVIEMHYGC